jgi:hypothetical protein
MRKYCAFIFCVGLCVAAALMFPPLSAAHPMVDASGCLACHDLGEFDLEGLHGTHTDCFACHEGPTERGNVHSSACLACHPRPLVNSELCSLAVFHEGSPGYAPSGDSCLSAGCHRDACADVTTTTTEPDTTCPAEAIYGEGSFEVTLLRAVRDGLLIRTPEGQALIKLYYQWSPTLVKAMQADEQLKEDVKEMVDGMLVLMAK